MSDRRNTATEPTRLRKEEHPASVRRRRIVLRFLLIGATLGSGAGLFEAALLYFTPRVPTLLEPDIGFAIWFLSPLLNLSFFALLGSALGWMASLGEAPAPRRTVILALVMIGFVGADVAWSLGLVHAQVGDFRLGTTLATPTISFAVVFAVALFLARLGWRRAVASLDGTTPLPRQPWAEVLMAATGALLAGLGFCWVWPFGFLTTTQARTHNPTKSPNVVLITLDTLRADHVSAYGYERPTTPHLDRLARQGALFENAIAPSSWTLPSHASIFTGLLPHQHGADSIIPLGQRPRTLAEVLKSHGYESAGFTSNLYYGMVGWGVGQGFEVYDDDSSLLRHNLASTLAGRILHYPFYFRLIQPDYYFRRNAEELNGEIFRWLDRRSDRPFFLFVNYFDVHYPYQAPAPFTSRFGDSPDVRVRRPDALTYGRPPRPLSAAEQKSLIAGYDNCLAYLDAQVGQLVEFFAGRPELTNTIWIITSDHGEGFGEHGTYDHGWDLYREVLHVPLILVGPGIPEGVRLAPIARIREIFPTVLDLTLGEKPPFQRTSLRRFWTPGFQLEAFDDMAIAEVAPSFPEPKVPVSISLTNSEWHYIHDATGRETLYRWKTDVQEKTDVSPLEENQQTLRALRVRLREVVEFSVRPWQGTEYLYALDQPGDPFLVGLAFMRPPRDPNSVPQLRIGISQAAFPPDAFSVGRQPHRGDQDLIESLPYH